MPDKHDGVSWLAGGKMAPPSRSVNRSAPNGAQAVDEHLPTIHSDVDAKAVTAAAAVKRAKALDAGTTSAGERE